MVEFGEDDIVSAYGNIGITRAEASYHLGMMKMEMLNSMEDLIWELFL